MIPNTNVGPSGGVLGLGATHVRGIFFAERVTSRTGSSGADDLPRVSPALRTVGGDPRRMRRSGLGFGETICLCVPNRWRVYNWSIRGQETDGGSP